MKTLFLIFALCASLAWCRTPGISITALEPTIDGFKNGYFFVLVDALKTIPIQDQDISGYTLQDIRFTTWDMDPNDFDVTLYDGYVELNANPFAFTAVMNALLPGSDTPSPISITGHDCNIKFDVTPGLDQNGVLQFTVSDVKLDLTNLQAYSTDTNLQDAVNAYLQNGDNVDGLEEAFMTSLTPALQEFFNSWGDQLPDSVALPKIPWLSLKTSMNPGPHVNTDGTNYISTFYDGTIFYTPNGYISPPIADPVVIPEYDPDDAGLGAQMFVADYVFNSALWASWINNELDGTAVDSQLPPASDLRLTTDSMEQVFPGLVAAMGAGKNMAISCMDFGGNAPNTAVQEGQVVANVSGLCDLYVIDVVWTRALSFTGDVMFTGVFSIDQNGLNYVVSQGTFNNLNLLNSAVPNLSSAAVQQNINTLFPKWLPYTGQFSLPLIPLGQITNPVLRMHTGYLEILADIVFDANENFNWQELPQSLGYNV